MSIYFLVSVHLPLYKDVILISGSVKEHDMHRYPPYGYMNRPEPEPQMYYTYIPIRQKSAPQKRPKPDNKHYTVYNNHAKNGFRYWYQEKEPPKCMFVD